MKPTAFKVLALCAAAILCLGSTTTALWISHPDVSCDPSSFNYKSCLIARQQLCKGNPDLCWNDKLSHKLSLARRNVVSGSVLQAANHVAVELPHKPAAAEHGEPTTSPLIRSLGGRPTTRREGKALNAGRLPLRIVVRKRRGFFGSSSDDDDDIINDSMHATDEASPQDSDPHQEPLKTLTDRPASAGSSSETPDYDASAWGPPKGHRLPRNDDLKNVPYYASSPAYEEMPGLSLSSESEVDTSDSHRPIEPKPFRDIPPKSIEPDSKASFAETPDYDASAWGPPTPSSPRNNNPYYASSPPDDDLPGQSLTIESQSDSEDSKHIGPLQTYQPSEETAKNHKDAGAVSESDYSRQINEQKKPFTEPAPDDSRDFDSIARTYKSPRKPLFVYRPPKKSDHVSENRFEGMDFSYEPQGTGYPRETQDMFQQANAGIAFGRSSLRQRNNTASA